MKLAVFSPLSVKIVILIENEPFVFFFVRFVARSNIRFSEKESLVTSVFFDSDGSFVRMCIVASLV